MSTPALYSIHFTKKIGLIRGSRAQCEQHFVYLNSDQLRVLRERLSQLLRNGLLTSASDPTPVTNEITTPFEQLDSILSKMCFDLPPTATPDDIRNAQSKSANAAAASAGQRAEKELMDRLRREREKEEKF